DVSLAGGGDSALDWTIYLANIAKSLSLIHRQKSFRGAPDSAEKLMHLAEEGKIRLILNSNITDISGNGHLEKIQITDKENKIEWLDTQHLVPLFGFTPILGPIENWGLELDKNAIKVNVEDYSTNIPGIYAIGDIN